MTKFWFGVLLVQVLWRGDTGTVLTQILYWGVGVFFVPNCPTSLLILRLCPPSPTPLLFLSRLRTPVKCSSLPWRSFERSRLGLPRWEFCKPSWISGQEVWKLQHLVSEIRLRGQPQITRCGVLVSNCVVLVHKSSRGGSCASFAWVVNLCVWTPWNCIVCRGQDWGLAQGLQIGPCGCEDPLLSPLLLCVKLSPLLLDLYIFSRETEKSKFYVKFPSFKKLVAHN